MKALQKIATIKRSGRVGTFRWSMTMIASNEECFCFKATAFLYNLCYHECYLINTGTENVESTTVKLHSMEDYDNALYSKHLLIARETKWNVSAHKE